MSKGKEMIQRDKYLNALIRKKWNGQIKVVTGVRRCGKSTLLFELFRDHLLQEGVSENNIISLALDVQENAAYRDPEVLFAYLQAQIANPEEKYYILLDEIQFAITKEELRNREEPIKLYGVLNGLVRKKNVDVYVTGSNSKLLSKDVMTEFRGRGDEVHVYPLSFAEYYSTVQMEKADAYDEYEMYGGMPFLLSLDTDEDKFRYLESLFEEIYFKDIEERYTILLPSVLRELTSDLCSSVGSLTNANKIARTLKTVKNVDTTSDTIGTYLQYLEESFLFEKADRYDVKGKKYFEYPSKFYCADVGLRNVRLNMRQQEPTHIMENVIYNELRMRGYRVDVGVVPVVETNEKGKRHQSNTEIDFIARKGSKTYYIQSAFRMEDEEKQKQELRPLLSVKDSFKKIIISRYQGKRWTDEQGILRLGLIDFLLDENSLEG